MRNGNIISIAAQLGWTASAQYKEGKLFFDFQRKTVSGVPFTFPAEMKDGKVSNLVKEIESFVDAIEPDMCFGVDGPVGCRGTIPFPAGRERHGYHPHRSVAVGLSACRGGRQIRLGRSALEPVELSSAARQVQRQPSIHEGCS